MRVIKFILITFPFQVNAIDSDLITKTITDSYLNIVYPATEPIKLVTNNVVVSLFDLFTPQKSSLDKAEETIYQAFNVDE